MIWLLDFSVKAGLLFCAAWATALLLRRSSAEVRHLLWLAALTGIAILALPVTVPKPVRIAAPVHFAVTSLAGAIQAPVRAWSWPHWPAIWIAGMILAFGRLLAGIMIIAVWTGKARRIGQMLVSDHAATPLTWGVFRPVILFPAYAEEWAAEQREIVLRHEQAHIIRRDWLWQTLANAINAVFWFHPLVWLANSEMRREAEIAADDLVLSSGADASDYAAQLVSVARRFSGEAALATVPMARRKSLERRVRHILDPLCRRSRASMTTRAAVVLFACACLIPLLAMQEGSLFGFREGGVTGGRTDGGSEARGGISPMSRAIVPAGAEVSDNSSAGTATSERAAPDGNADHGVPSDPGAARAGAASGASGASGASDAATHQISEPGMQAPRLLYKQDPRYSEEARIAKIEGTVVLKVVIDEQGRADDIQVTRSLDPGLDEQAIEAVQHWQFSPGLKDGRPVRVAASIEVNFRLL